MVMIMVRKIACYLPVMPFLLFLCSAQAEQEPQSTTLDAGMVNPGYAEKPDWFVNSFLDIREDIGDAAAEGKRVLLYFYQDGCPYCKKLLDTNLALKDT
jgi:thioredoxin-related protein